MIEEGKPLSILVLLVKFLWDAILTHAASDEGKQQLTEILDDVEAAGIDVPFYEPSEESKDTSTEEISQEGNDSDEMKISHGGRRVYANGEAVE